MSNTNDTSRPLIFISYRRADTKRHVGELARGLAQNFGADVLFVDTDSIRTGEDWEAKIIEALDAATLVLVAIGEQWLSQQDNFFRRRIDNEDDWVRTEIAESLAAGKDIIPILFDGQPPLHSEALPESIAALAGKQAISLRDADWQQDTNALHKQLAHYGFEKNTKFVHYPSPTEQEPPATTAEVEAFLGRNPGWRVQLRPHPTDPNRQRRGIGTTLTFSTFADAIHFMSTAARGIDQRNHHPEWENIWTSIVVWITQFDIEGDVTVRNIELAEYLMTVYKTYAKTTAALDP